MQFSIVAIALLTSIGVAGVPSASLVAIAIILTAIGLKLIFGMPYVAFLSLIVFVCGFIPVAGVFISSVPICLVGLVYPTELWGLISANGGR